MKKLLKIIGGVILTAYILVAIFLTACLLTYNDYKISEFGNKSLIILEDNELAPTYKKGSVLVITRTEDSDIKTGDDIFFYNMNEDKVVVSTSKVTKKEVITDTETTYTVTGDFQLSSDYVIGKADTAVVIDNAGTALKLLESKWGFLIFIVLPVTLLFLYEIFAIINEIRKPTGSTRK